MRHVASHKCWDIVLPWTHTVVVYRSVSSLLYIRFYNFFGLLRSDVAGIVLVLLLHSCQLDLLFISNNQVRLATHLLCDSNVEMSLPLGRHLVPNSCLASRLTLPPLNRGLLYVPCKAELQTSEWVVDRAPKGVCQSRGLSG